MRLGPIGQGSYPLDATTLKLLLNGVDVAAKSTVTAAGNPQGITVTYASPILQPGTNTVELVLADKNTPPMTLDTTYAFTSPASPALSASQAAGKVIISWPVSATGTLQETSALPGGWKDFTASINVQGSLNVVEIAPTGKATFYRLGQ